MTRQAEHNYQCDECTRTDLICPMCGKTVMMGTAFSKWLRVTGESNGDLSSEHLAVHNLDFICYWYKKGWFITIEEKQYSGIPNSTQRDTHGVVSQLLAIASGSEIKTLNAKFRKRGRVSEQVEYRGHFVVSFDNTSPDDSQRVWINDDLYTGEDVQRAVLWLLQHGNTPFDEYSPEGF